MKFAKICLRAATRLKGGSYFGSLKSTALRFLSFKEPDQISFPNRLRSFVKINLTIFSLPFRLKKSNQKIILGLFVGKREMEERAYFLQRFAKGHPSSDLIHFYDPLHYLDKLVYRKMTLSRIWNLTRASVLLWKAEFVSLFFSSKVSPGWHFQTAQLLFQQILFHDPKTDIYLFYCFHPATYMSSYLATCFLKNYHPKIFSSNSVLFENNRYLFHPDCDFIICSTFQQEETSFYRKNNWMVLRSTEYWGSEDIKKMDSIPFQEPTVDIGVYCSGFWARNETGWRIMDYSTLPNNYNPWHLVFVDILKVCGKLKKQFPELSIKLYFHPYERKLFRENNITPPYLDLLRENKIDFSLDGLDSMDEFYQSKIAITTQSTIIFDRFNYGLEGYFYSGKEKWKPIATEYLGKWGKFGFRNMDELEALLNEKFVLHSR